jgi:serine/threonine protein phosphatase 1
MTRSTPFGILLGRQLAIGDVHGCSTALDRLLEVVSPAYADNLIFLGDYVGKGPDSAVVLDRLIRLSADFNVIPLLGNHDEMLLDAVEGRTSREPWANGSRVTTIASYGGDLANVPAEHVDFLKSCRDGYETDDHLLVHANIDSTRALSDQSPELLRWTRFTGEEPPHFSGKRVICGHAAQKSGEPLNVGHAVCIDTYCWGGGWLTCLDLDKGHIWQASEAGETRTAWLNDHMHLCC